MESYSPPPPPPIPQQQQQWNMPQPPPPLEPPQTMSQPLPPPQPPEKTSQYELQPTQLVEETKRESMALHCVRLLIPVFFLQAAVDQIRGANIEILTEGKAAECGKKYTLTCKIGKGHSLLAWMIEGDVVPIARCFENKCSLTTNYVEKYKLDNNVEEGFYSLTILNLTITEIRRSFSCSSGFESVTKKILLKDYKVMLSEDTENSEITVTSGYIAPDTNVMFKWTKIDADDKQESDLRMHVLHTSATMYSNTSGCSTNQLIRHSIVISAIPSDRGKYYLKMSLTYGNETVVTNTTTLKYNIEEQVVNNGKSSDELKIDKSVIYIFIAAVIFVMVLIVICLCVQCLICRNNFPKPLKRQQDSFAEDNTAEYIKLPMSSSSSV